MAKGRALTPLGVILKWILIPAVLVAIGYFAIGARIGRFIPGFGGSSDVPQPVAEAKSSSKFSSPDVNIRTDRKMEAPDVQVTARKKPRHRRQRANPVPTSNTSMRSESSSAAQTMERATN